MAVKVQGDTVIYDDKVFKVGSGTTSERPASPVTAMVRYNVDYNSLEYRNHEKWVTLRNAGEMQYFIENPGTDWLKLDGSVVLQSQYPKLFNAYGLIPNGLDYYALRTSGTTSTIRSITLSNNTYVYAGDGGVLATSTDAITWTARTSGTTSNIQKILYANNTYVYAGDGGVLATSTDAITWTARTSGTTSIIKGLAYGNGVFVYVGYGGVIATSTDAITWTARTSGTTANLKGVAYGNGVFVAAGEITTSVLVSSDGISWTPYTKALTNRYASSVAFGNGVFVILEPGGGYSYTEYSTNGTSWTSAQQGNSYTYEDAIYYQDGIFILGSSYNNAPRVMYSTDGISWTDVGSAKAGGTKVSAVTICNGTFYAFDTTGGVYRNSYNISFSTYWASVKQHGFNTVIYADGKYLAGGNNFTIAASTDGVTWEARTSGTATYGVTKLDYADNTYYYATTTTNSGTSTDGITWTARTSISTTGLTYVNYNTQNKYFVSVGATALTAFKQIDNQSELRTFSVSALPFPPLDIVYNSNTLSFVCVGNSGGVLTFPLFNYNPSTEFVIPKLDLTTSNVLITELPIFSIQKVAEKFEPYYKE